jgi:RNA polymerase sigma factor (sigma-70 family)
LLEYFAREGDQAAFAELVRRHGPMVLGVCRRILGDVHAAEDAFQAVFLVLARRAGAVRWRESVGGWLHGVARRVALKARAKAARQHDPARWNASPPADPAEEVAAREMHRLLDQELQGLPAKYRGPLVLCDLEGKTHEEAARELGWPRGSLAKRLAGARQRLRARLLRRGVVLSAGAALAAGNDHTAAVPAELAGAAAQAAAGTPSVTATALAKGVVLAMWLTRTAVAAMAVVLLGGSIGLGVLAYRAPAAPAPAPKGDPPAARDKDRKESKAVNVDGVEFRAYVQGTCVVPRPGESRPIDLGLRITNKTDGPLFFSLLDTVRLVLKTAEGMELRMDGGRKNAPPQRVPVPVAAGESLDVSRASRLEALGLRAGLRLGGREGTGFDWYFDGLRPGKYVLSVRYEGEKGGICWPGKAETEGVEFEIVEAQSVSKPVRVEGLEFTVFVPVRRVATPPPGDRSDVDLGLKVVNVSDKPVSLSINNVIRLRLDSRDGESNRMQSGRDGKPKPQPPVTLAPGGTWTWRSGADLHWVGGDRTTLQLYGPDGRGVAGFWSFGTMKQKKYWLTIEYENTNPNQDGVPLWVGKATPKEVAFEVLSCREVGANRGQEEAIKEELKRLQGPWKRLDCQLVIEGDKYSFSGLSGTLRIDPTRKPKWIEGTFGDGQKPRLYGIYELDGSTLKLSWKLTDDPEDRPTDISKAADYRRAKEDTGKP